MLGGLRMGSGVHLIWMLCWGWWVHPSSTGEQRGGRGTLMAMDQMLAQGEPAVELSFAPMGREVKVPALMS